MNRIQWYRQRRIYRIKELVYFSYGDEAPSAVYQAYADFDPVIKKSCTGKSTSAYDMREIMSKIESVRRDHADKLHLYKDTVRDCMRYNTTMARALTAGSTPCYYFRGFT